jgi:hypothetical protein
MNIGNMKQFHDSADSTGEYAVAGKIEAKSVDANEGSCDQNVQLIASNPK